MGSILHKTKILVFLLLVFFVTQVSSAQAAALSIVTPSPQSGVVGSAFSLQISASGGTGGYQFALASGSLPSGLTLDTNSGEISGIPTASQSSTITVRVTDNSSATATTNSFVINTGWVVSTFAGNGSNTTSGDGGLATSAGMDPHGLSVAPDGTVYFSDMNTNRIRKISTNGIVSNVVSTNGSPLGLVAKENGDIYFTLYTSNSRLQKYTSSTNTYAAFSDATPTFNSTRGLIADSSGNFYIADAQNNLIRKVTNSGVTSTYAGNGSPQTSGDGGQATSASINYPGDVAVDSTGTLYITELNGNLVRKVRSDGVISTFVANGTYTGEGVQVSAARTAGVWGIAVDGGDNVFLMERNGKALRRVDAQTGEITRVAGTGISGTNGSPINGISSQATFSTLVMAIRFDIDGNLYIIDYSNKMIRKIAGLGTPFTVASPTFTITPISNLKKGVLTQITSTASAAGKVTFYANGKRIPGCISLRAVGNPPITVTCSWKPKTSGGATLKALFTATSAPQTPIVANMQLVVGRRTTVR